MWSSLISILLHIANFFSSFLISEPLTKSHSSSDVKSPTTRQRSNSRAKDDMRIHGTF